MPQPPQPAPPPQLIMIIHNNDNNGGDDDNLIFWRSPRRFIAGNCEADLQQVLQITNIRTYNQRRSEAAGYIVTVGTLTRALG